MTSEAHFEVYEDDAGEHRWRFKGANGEIMAVSSEGYTSEGHAVRGTADLVQAIAPSIVGGLGPAVLRLDGELATAEPE